MPEQKCLSCGTVNRTGAKYCQKCGNELGAGAADESLQGGQPLLEQGTSAMEEIVNKVMDVGGLVTKRLKNIAGDALQQAGDSRKKALTVMQLERVQLLQAGNKAGGYLIIKAWPLQRSAYYQVRSLQCPQGHDNPKSGQVRCVKCQQVLPLYLMHQTIAPGSGTDEELTRQITRIANNEIPGVWRHQRVFSQGDQRFVLLDYPGEGWMTVAQAGLPVNDPTRLRALIFNAGEALRSLWQLGYALEPPASIDLLESFILLQVQGLFVADLAVFNLTVQQPPTSQKKHIACLNQLLYSLASGQQQSLNRAPAGFSDTPLPYRNLLDKARRDGYADIKSYLDAVREVSVPVQSKRGLRQNAGHRTDIGKVRDHNEDFVGKYSLGLQQLPEDPELGVYLVADGMGGHQAGEKASSEVTRVILQEIKDKEHKLKSVPKVQRATINLEEVVSPGEVLKKAILQANQVLISARQARSSDRGTTITAALVVGDMCAVANVGDSRTYLMRAGKLEQVTEDHSLVAKLLAANVIRPEEVRTHPNRNQIYRTLGDKAQVDIDIFQRTLQAGDRLLLCSDGLWEMVLDADIEATMRQAATPTAACDRLVEQAILAGGEDNIGVVVVWIE